MSRKEFNEATKEILDEITSPDFPKTKKIHEIVDKLIEDNQCLVDKEFELKQLIIEHYKAFFQYSRGKLKKKDYVALGQLVLMEGLIAHSFT
ncbi:MAG: hypothetical protein ABID38_05270 [Candidatus Diapherotrites archaeon]